MRPASRSVLITGASTGIGLYLAERLAGEGWRVFAGCRQAQDATRLQSLHATGVIPVMLDVTRDESIAAGRAALQATVGEHGLDALINNAGVAVAGPVEAVPLEEWRRQFDVNVLGVIAITQAMLPLVRIARGRIVMMSSISGLLAYPMLGPYSASKHALEALSDSLRLELAPEGIGVTLIEPGQIRTPIWEKSIGEVVRREAAWEPALRQRYGALAASVSREARRSSAAAPDAGIVWQAVSRTLNAARPPPRILVGAGAKFGWLLSRLPCRWRDFLIRRAVAGGRADR